MKDQIRDEVALQMNSAVQALTEVIYSIKKDNAGLKEAIYSVKKENAVSNSRIEALMTAHMVEDTETHKQQQDFFSRVEPMISDYMVTLETLRVSGRLSGWIFKRIIPAALAILALYAGFKGLTK